ncbi:hypothetical protein [Deinococcus multiflagellatus]|uniref:Cyanophycinase n=1 Tax=Deinococcus multiflagellatus TaxID=1656887 RepID=A0ABW1ZIN1_9DEIO
MAKDQEQHTQDRDHQERGARLGRGTLIIIGGHEDKERGREILKEVARHVDGGRLVIATVASHKPEGYFESYQQGFDGLNVGELTELYIDERPEASHPEKLALFDGARGSFSPGATSCASPARLATRRWKRASARSTSGAAWWRAPRRGPR